ncbi:Lysine-oxoglutarate reductase/Saccharopine dehydrogenase family enzyme [Methanonatronarchaeum thermophilum]|uniref:Ornithine cyclodeaminase n=1 Tax=Methanonatronarchaeum thermophilum TaxID=1927129 RepID=A0A1Y3GFJ0_9EURY|nr:TIGR00300 family protein [Methanonatronarchaeum thermophilum]OUJ19063.1 Lysine-oxoglutarate reductase/Saccharopine dehydrogenase family enzyme [Methanonatronarchaeum thermophilum]
MSIREIELEGHIIDSMTLPKVFDSIIDMGGDFEVLEFDIGKHKTDKSYTRIQIEGRDEEHLDSIMSEIHRHGATLPEIMDVECEEAPSDVSLPDNFYSTTNHQTYVRHGGRWVEVQNIEMDCVIVLEGVEAVCKPISHVKKGDNVVVGEKGIRVIPPERPREKSVFEFMGSHVSSEKPSDTLIEQVANEIKETKKSGGKIGFVLGPAVLHTGCSEEISTLIRQGYVDVVFGGNAIGVHDIERAIYGTSLGVDLCEGRPRPDGHKNHLYAISEVVKSGSIQDAIEDGKINSGIMYECEVNDVPYILAGSIRDDGPLPEVITDTVEAQEAMRENIKDLDLVIMMATMLHSIATGNILPSHVKTICIDINPATVTKLMDRGTAQAMGIVTDVGVFIPRLTNRILEDC